MFLCRNKENMWPLPPIWGYLWMSPNEIAIYIYALLPYDIDPGTISEDIMKTRLFKYIENFTSKNLKFSDKKTLIFFIFLLKT